MPSLRRLEPLVVLTAALASAAALVVARRLVAPPSWLCAAVPLLWAGLFLYGPVRLGTWAVWREVRRVAPDARDRRALAIVLVVAAGLLCWGIDWGLAGDLWAPDELRPDLVREVIALRLSQGWYDKYPLMHYAVLALPVSAFPLAEWAGMPAPDPVTAFAAPLLVMRVVSVVLGLGALVAAFLCGVELQGPRRAVFGSLALLLTPLLLFYGKLANLDVPALCWLGFALVCFLRLARRQVRADYVGLGIFAAAAVATKDQAYANLALLPLAVIVVTAQRLPGAWWRRLVRGVLHPDVLLGGLASAVAFAVFNNALFNFQGLVDHFALLSTLGDLAIVPRTAPGLAHLTGLTADLFRLAVGWPLLLCGVAGVLVAVARPDRRWWLWLLMVPLAFHLTFTAVTLYVNDRYLFGGVFVLALFAGATLADLIDRVPRGGWARALAAGTVGYSLLYAASIDVMMNLDARDAARRYVYAHLDDGARVGMVGGYTPYLPPPADQVRMPETPAGVGAVRPDWIIMNARYAKRFDAARSPDGRQLVAALRDGSLGYTEVFRYRAAPPVWALLQYDPAFTGDAESPLTNLDKVNPETVIFHRVR